MNDLSSLKTHMAKLFAGEWNSLEAANDAMRSPGVYLIAYTDSDLAGKAIDLGDIYYVGMSNAKNGVAQRLKQFIKGISIGRGHSGANRWYAHVSKGISYIEYARTDPRRFYFSAHIIPCNSDKGESTPEDFRVMGLVAALEYFAIAWCLEQTGERPVLNKLGTSAIET